MSTKDRLIGLAAFLMLIPAVIALLCGSPASPRESVLEQVVIAEATPPIPVPTSDSIIGRKMPPPLSKDELAMIARANADRLPAPVFRSVPIRPAARGTVTTTRAGNGFVIGFRDVARGTQIAPTIHGGLLLTGGPVSERALHAFDARTGTHTWSLSLADNGVSALACDGDFCAFTTESCSLYVADVTTGTGLWGRWLADPLMSAPALADGVVYAAYPRRVSRDSNPLGGALAAFDARNGDVVWHRFVDEDVMGSPIVVDGAVEVTTLSGARFRFDARTGRALSSSIGRPLALARTTGVPTAEGAAYLALRPVGSPIASRVLALPDVTIRRDGRDVVAKAADGTRLWKAEIGATTPPIPIANGILVGTETGVVRLDPDTGEEKARWLLGTTARAEPIADGGWVYAATDDGLVAIDTKDPDVTGWPQWGGNARRHVPAAPAESATSGAP